MPQPWENDRETPEEAAARAVADAERRIAHFRQVYVDACRKVGKGLGIQAQVVGDKGVSATPLDLRLSVTVMMMDSWALAQLLAEKGVIGLDEWMEALAKTAEAEVVSQRNACRTLTKNPTLELD